MIKISSAMIVTWILLCSIVCAEVKVNDNGTWKAPLSVFVNDNGTWKSPSIYVNDTGTWKLVALIDGQQYGFSWDITETANVTGFNIYLNDTLLCTSSNPTDRTLTCNSTSPVPSPASFYITMIRSDTGESSPSNTLTYTAN